MSTSGRGAASPGARSCARAPRRPRPMSAGCVSLPPKPPPMRRHCTVTALRAYAQGLRDDLLHLGRVLGRAVDQHPAVLLRQRDRDLSLQIEMILAADVHRAAAADAAPARAPPAGGRAPRVRTAARSCRPPAPRGCRVSPAADRSRHVRARAAARARRVAKPRRPRTAAGRRIAPGRRRRSDHRDGAAVVVFAGNVAARARTAAHPGRGAHRRRDPARESARGRWC